jgi:hypothetical protein
MYNLKLPFEETPIFILDGRQIEFPEAVKTDTYTHTLHRFPGKFIPQVAYELLKIAMDNNRSDYVLDPFCGSGTTLVEAATSGINSIGLDLDSLATFVSKAKTTPLSDEQLTQLTHYWKRTHWSSFEETPLPAVENLSHWFAPECSRQLAKIKSQALALTDEVQRNFSLAVFSSIIRRVSNADDQTQKTYVSGTLKKKPPLPAELFPVFLSRAISGIAEYSRYCQRIPLVQQSDARNLDLPFSIAAIATSPPYIDSIDYVYNQMLEYYWMSDILNVDLCSIKALRKQPMGFRRVNVEGELSILETYSREAARELRPLVLKVGDISKVEAANIVGYFSDFGKHICAVKGLLVDGGRYALVVGESVIRGFVIPTPDLLCSLFDSLGFKFLGRCSYLIKRHYMKFPRRQNSGTIKIDHVLCFEK